MNRLENDEFGDSKHCKKQWSVDNGLQSRILSGFPTLLLECSNRLERGLGVAKKKKKELASDPVTGAADSAQAVLKMAN